MHTYVNLVHSKCATHTHTPTNTYAHPHTDTQQQQHTQVICIHKYVN